MSVLRWVSHVGVDVYIESSVIILRKFTHVMQQRYRYTPRGYLLVLHIYTTDYNTAVLIYSTV